MAQHYENAQSDSAKGARWPKSNSVSPGKDSRSSTGSKLMSKGSEIASAAAATFASSPRRWLKVFAASKSYAKKHPVIASFAGIAGVGVLSMLLRRRY